MLTVPPITDLTQLNQLITTYLYSKEYLKQATAVLLDTSGKYSWAQMQDAYNFIQAYKNGTDFTSTFDIGDGFSAGVQIHLSLFKGNPIIQSVGSQIAAAVDTALQQIQGTMQDPSLVNAASVDTIYDSQTGKPASRLDMLLNPTHGFYFQFTNSDMNILPCNMNHPPAGTVYPNWCDEVPTADYDEGDGNSDWDVHNQVEQDTNDNDIPFGGFDVHDVVTGSSLNDNPETFTVSCTNAGALIPYMQSTIADQGVYNGASAAVADALALLKN